MKPCNQSYHIFQLFSSFVIVMLEQFSAYTHWYSIYSLSLPFSLSLLSFPYYYRGERSAICNKTQEVSIGCPLSFQLLQNNFKYWKQYSRGWNLLGFVILWLNITRGRCSQSNIHRVKHTLWLKQSQEMSGWTRSSLYTGTLIKKVITATEVMTPNQHVSVATEHIRGLRVCCYWPGPAHLVLHSQAISAQWHEHILNMANHHIGLDEFFNVPKSWVPYGVGKRAETDRTQATSQPHL